MFPLPAFAGAADTESDTGAGAPAASSELTGAADKELHAGTDTPAASAEVGSAADVPADSEKWTSEDFTYTDITKTSAEIGRASCRERV